MPAPTGATRVCAVIGSPIRHSLSPALHNAAFEALGLDWVFVAHEVAAGRGADAMAAARTLGLAGVSVTMPLKEEVAGAVDVLAADAAALRAVNCVVNERGRLVGHNTDGAGFLASLGDMDVAGSRCLVLGAGGAGRAVARALGAAGAAVSVWNRTPARAAEAATLAGADADVARTPSVAGFDLVVNATPAGMAGTGADAAAVVDPSELTAGHVVVDLVYHPETTPLLAEAGARGARTVGGLGMLVHQAAAAFELWVEQPAPIEVMMAAAQRVLRAG